MSEENLQRFRVMMDAYAKGDKATWKSFMDCELVTFPTSDWPEPGPFAGPDAAWAFYRQFEDALNLREGYEFSELISAGDKVLVCQQAPVRGQASGAEVVFRLWGVHRFAAGRIIQTEWFRERNEALKAAGMSE